MGSSKARLNSGDVAPGDRTAEAKNLARFQPASEGRRPYKEKATSSVRAAGRAAPTRYLLRESIFTVAGKLKRYGFIRVHRSALVNSSFDEEIQPCSTGEHLLRVKAAKKYSVPHVQE
jgi:hypothetical protein